MSKGELLLKVMCWNGGKFTMSNDTAILHPPRGGYAYYDGKGQNFNEPREFRVEKN